MKRMTPLLMALVIGAAFAQAKDLSLTATMSQVKKVTVSGKVTEQLIPSPKSIFPGDILSQVVVARNVSKNIIKNAVVNLPVPKNTVYMAPESNMDVARTEYSIDGGKTYAIAPLKKTVTVMENGKSVKKEIEVKPNEYTNVRWVISTIAANQSLKVGYRIQVK